jgi:hypothetical protein
VIVALLAVGAFVVLGGDDGDDPAAPDDTTENSSDSTETVDILTEPVDVTRAFFAALGEGDCAQMMSLLTEGSLFPAEQTPEQTLATCEASVDDGSISFTGMAVGDVRLESMAGDVATVAVDFTLNGQASTEQIQLQLVDGQWKLDLPGST